MARFGELVPTSGRYVNAADKAELSDLAVPLRLVRATYQPRAMFGPRWLIDCAQVGGGEPVAIDFAAASKDGAPIEARQTMFAELRDRLDAGEVFEPVVLESVTPAKGGNAFWTFRDATPAELADPTTIAFPAEDDEVESIGPDAPAPIKVGRQRLAKAAR